VFFCIERTVSLNRIWNWFQFRSNQIRCCTLSIFTTMHTYGVPQRPENRQHNSFKLLCCGFLGNTTKWNCCVADVPTAQRKLRWPRSANVQKTSTQQLKTVMLWVFWTLALVGHRTYAFIAHASLLSNRLSVTNFGILWVLSQNSSVKTNPNYL